MEQTLVWRTRFQSLFYWITYSYNFELFTVELEEVCFNPYFIGLPILIIKSSFLKKFSVSFNPYFIGLPILINAIRIGENNVK